MCSRQRSAQHRSQTAGAAPARLLCAAGGRRLGERRGSVSMSLPLRAGPSAGNPRDQRAESSRVRKKQRHAPRDSTLTVCRNSIHEAALCHPSSRPSQRTPTAFSHTRRRGCAARTRPPAVRRADDTGFGRIDVLRLVIADATIGQGEFASLAWPGMQLVLATPPPLRQTHRHLKKPAPTQFGVIVHSTATTAHFLLSIA